MSDQEPVGKRMLGQLRDHTEPYQPEAWEHFEAFRAEKKGKRRIIFYWLTAAALLVIFGTALLLNRATDRGMRAKYPVAQHHANRRDLTEAKIPLPNDINAPGPSKQASVHQQAVKSKKMHSNRENPAADLGNFWAKTRDQLPEHSPSMISYERLRGNFTLDLLSSRPFTSPLTHFSAPHIPPQQQQMHITPETVRTIRWGIAISQQSNRAAHTEPELNYGLGGALLLPLSGKLALVTGILGSKQSLNVEEPERLAVSEGSAQLQRARYHWMNLEVPLQIQYKLKTFKNLGFTAAGGIALQSSLRQQTDYIYKNRRTITTFAETAGGPVLVSTQTIEELSSITENDKKRTWAFGSPLYFGLGISYQWQHTAIEVEPYVKYPLGASTAERLQLTTLGIHLRMTAPFRR
ncbi:MAG TPA: hypothetical protein VN038_26275 [Dyadobacter sp.]|nr:hypothetical protein [Dyadobacter sp.]